ncbi:protein of unknown function DUF192 [Sulfobacillus acidophilus TPY]|uniref:DUF192 domain-containing protein n=1 Tax=Sulfobacillus acidophilus (strain ATCC 700253 / DSM 10332 / NAL) TaxID=679936 RepID=G8TS03_SULAD|nr:protein of unknown function DUF192 [Sulfobacillus acidophilus TPY]AEW04329.1 protein of unknown function DUF192 [Sulfobacillus acidophilus DSM 10332]
MIQETGHRLLRHVTRADRFGQRFWGLMGRHSLGADEGLWFPQTTAIHTFFMRFPLGVVYLSWDNEVIAKERVIPWRFGSWHSNVSQVVEILPDLLSQVQVGTHWLFQLAQND